MRIVSDTEILFCLLVAVLTITGTTCGGFAIHPVMGAVVLCTWAICISAALLAGIKDEEKEDYYENE